MVELLHELAKAGLLQLVLLNLHHLLLPPGYDDGEGCENNHDNDGDDDGNYDEKSKFRQKNFGDENVVLVTPNCQCPYIIDVLKV